MTHCKELLHRLPHQDDDGKHPKDRSKRHEQAFHARHDEAEGIPPALGKTAPCGEDKSGEHPAEGDEDRSHDDEYPTEPGGGRPSLALKVLRREKEHQTQDQVDDGKTRQQPRQAGDHIVEDRQQPQLILVL